MSDNQNTGHGHVWPRPDGMKAKCGGPALCPMCKRDAAGMMKDADGNVVTGDANGPYRDSHSMLTVNPAPHAAVPNVASASKTVEVASGVEALDIPAFLRTVTAESDRYNGKNTLGEDIPDIARLFKFYAVTNLLDLCRAQADHIERLQQRVTLAEAGGVRLAEPGASPRQG